MGSLALGILLVAAPATSHAPFHPGLGYMMSGAVPVDPSEPPKAKKAPPAFVYTPRSARPPSNYELVRASRGAKLAQIGVAVAAQASMIIYGVLSVLDQRDEARRRRADEPPPFNPHPR